MAMSGCGATGPATPLQPVAVDLASTRCPPVDPRTRAEFNRLTPPPAVGDLKIEHVDALDASQIRKNLTGRRLIAEYDKCAGTAPTPPPVKKAEPKTS